MSGERLAAVPRLHASALLAIGLGVIFLLACGSSSPAESATTATPTPTVYLVRPTPTLSSPVVTPPTIDTSDWKTYRTSSGVSIRYPPTWAVQKFPGDPSGFVKLLNEHRQETVAQLPTQTEGGRSGDAWVDISPWGQVRFEVDELLQLCQPQSPADGQGVVRDAVEVTVVGQPAVWCVSQGPDVYTACSPTASTPMRTPSSC